jgi:hypothetical protein
MGYRWLGLLGGLLLTSCTVVKLEETRQPEIDLEVGGLQTQESALDEVPPLGDIQAWGPQNKYYSGTNENFPNPERGLTPYHDILFPNLTTLQGLYAQGYTLVRSDILLDKWRYSSLPTDFLNRLDSGLDVLRKAGIKTIIRFMYISPALGSDFSNALDAPLNIVQTHIRQLAPIFQKDADVMAVLQGGFIGAWGEWHSSAYGLTTPQNKTTILNELLSAMPADRMVQVRTVPDIADRFGSALNSGEAFRGSAKSRVGLKNMCFLANQDDAGTYSWNYQTWQYYKDYLAQASNYMAVGGETCEVNASNNRAACSIAVPEMGRYHWSYINSVFYRPTIDRWIREGCYYTIQQKLGYRFRMVQATLPSGVNPGESFEMALSLANDGFAAPYNPRSFEVVFRHIATGQIARARVGADPRFWTSNQTQTLKFSVAVPPSMPTGDYEMSVNMPDPKTTLYSNPKFSIRLANAGSWQASTGFNSLNHILKVGGTPVTPPPPSLTPPPPPTPTPPPAPTPTNGVLVNISPNSAQTLGVGSTLQLSASVIDRASGQKVADQRVRWVSSNWAAVSVDENTGIITVKKAETAKIYALSVPYSPEGASVQISGSTSSPTSPPPPPPPPSTTTSVLVRSTGATSYTLSMGAKQQLGVSVIDRANNQPIADQRIKWMSSNWQSIGVDANGLVTVYKPGTATIYALSVPFNPEGVAIRITAQ